MAVFPKDTPKGLNRWAIHGDHDRYDKLYLFLFKKYVYLVTYLSNHKITIKSIFVNITLAKNGEFSFREFPQILVLPNYLPAIVLLNSDNLQKNILHIFYRFNEVLFR